MNTLEKPQKNGVGAAFAAVSLFSLAGFAFAAIALNMGSVGNFAVLAGSAITNTGSSVVTGDLGLSPGTAVTGFPPGTVQGMQHVANAAAAQAQADLATAYNAALGQPAALVASELGGTVKTAGVYTSADGTFGITGTLTLDAQGDPNAVFIFQSPSTLITAGGSGVVLANGAQACNVFWQVGSSATLGVNSTFKGNIFALTSVTLTTGANVEGRVLARNGAVTLDSNTITRATCATVVPPPAPTPTTTPIVPPVVTPPVVTPPIIFPPVPPVITTTPTFPNTGIPPYEVPGAIVILAWVLMLASVATVGLVLGKRAL